MTNTILPSTRRWRSLCWALLIITGLPGIAIEAADRSVSLKVNVDALRHIPVFHKGRIQPFDTFSNIIMAEVCERPKKRNVTLGLTLYLDDKKLADKQFAAALELFPNGESRKLDSAELVYSWLVEQEKWEDVPFLYAPHPLLRKLLDVPVKHMKFKYVSPRQVLESEGLQKHVQSIQDRKEEARQREEKFIPSLLDQQVQKLIDRYQVYRTISFDARKPLTLGPLMTPGSRADFMMKAELVARLLQENSPEGRSFHNMLQIFAEAPGEGEIKVACQSTLQSIQAIFQIADSLRRNMQAITMGAADMDEPVGNVSLAEAAKNAQQFVLATQELDSHFQDQKLSLAKQFGEMNIQQQEGLSKIFREMISKSKELKRLARETQLALYSASHQNQSKPFKTFQSPMVMPALNAAALDKNRDVRNSSQPWLSMQAILYGDDVMKGYPQSALQEVRKAWKITADHYRNRTSKSRAKDFAKAQEKLASSLRSLGKSLEKQRLELVNKELEPHHRDDDLISYTQYPIAGKDLQRLNIEVRYNRINPFKRSFILCLLALAMFSVAFGKMRKNIFALAIVVCLATLLWTAYGFYLRIMITSWAPVTNMYETVIWVPFATLALATWFLLWPITQTGARNSWRLTAIPGSWEAKPLTESQQQQLSPENWKRAGWVSVLVRLGIMTGMFYFLTMMPLGDGSRPYFNIIPDLGSSQGHAQGLANTLGVWGVGLFCVLLAIWLLPRLILAIAASVVLVPMNCRQTGQFSQMMEEVYQRRSFALAGTALASVCFLLACLAPNDALDENISALQPVLRTNFWLTIHVLCIVSSYAAGALAMGLGNVALFHYLFGKYRKPGSSADLSAVVSSEGTSEGAESSQDVTSDEAADQTATEPSANPEPPRKLKPRPPEACAALASHAYKAIKVAVLLLAAGTILGGLWADVSWGRFWGWDPKEVWALISLLVYLAILHGRYAGWFSNFGLIFGTVLGATMIVMSWYGVNFVLPMLSTSGEVGLHSYGSGAGGLEYVAGFVIANWLFLAAATTRYTISTSGT